MFCGLLSPFRVAAPSTWGGFVHGTIQDLGPQVYVVSRSRCHPAPQEKAIAHHTAFISAATSGSAARVL